MRRPPTPSPPARRLERRPCWRRSTRRTTTTSRSTARSGLRSTAARGGSAGRTTRLSLARPAGRRPRRHPRHRHRAELALAVLLRRAARLRQSIGVTTFVTLGALLADVPHTRPVPITGTSADPELAARLGLEPSHYEGPTGIVGVIQDAAAPPGSRRCRTGRRSRTTSRSRRRRRRRWRCSPARGPDRRPSLRDLPRRPRPGSAASTSSPPTTTTSPTTSARSRRRRTPPTCRRPPATRSRRSSSATCAGAGSSRQTLRPRGAANGTGGTETPASGGEPRGARPAGRRPGDGATGPRARRPVRGNVGIGCSVIGCHRGFRRRIS